MDGGGRFLRPLSAGLPGRAGARASSSGGRLARLHRKLPRFLGLGLTVVFFGIVAVTGAIVGGHVDAFRQRHGEPRHALARFLGLGLDQVTIAGIARLTEPEILATAGISPKVSLALLDAAEMRDRLERMPLVKSASVRKLYPNELVVTLVEREPHGLWQLTGELFVIAADGTVIDLMQDERFASLPLVVGDKANTRTQDYLKLREAAGPLKARIRAGTLVSGRRWTLKMDNGTDVRLPELGAAEALARLVRLEREQKILDKDALVIDLRMPDRVVVRLTEEAAAARADALKKKPMRGKGVDT
jgi:cell division protein FtsQ